MDKIYHCRFCTEKEEGCKATCENYSLIFRKEHDLKNKIINK
jgi:hypothetical protein